MFPTRTRSIQVAVGEGVELMTRVRVQLNTSDVSISAVLYLTH